MTELMEDRSTRLGVDVVGGVNVLLAASITFAAFLVLFRTLHLGLASTNVLVDVQLPLATAAALLALGVTIAWTAFELLQRREDAREATIGIAAILVGTVYLHMHVVSILLTGTVFGNDPALLTAGVLAATAYAVPILYYLTLDDVRATFRPAPLGGETAGRPGVADDVETVDAEPVGGARTLEPTVVQGEPIEGGSVPEGAVAETRCTRCDTPIAVAARRRPVLVECPQCGLHGELGGPETETEPRRPETSGRGYV